MQRRIGGARALAILISLCAVGIGNVARAADRPAYVTVTDRKGGADEWPSRSTPAGGPCSTESAAPGRAEPESVVAMQFMAE